MMETTAEPSVPPSMPPSVPSVVFWILDLDVGDLTLEIDNSEGLNVSTVNCSAIQIVRRALDTNHSGIECGSSPLLSGSMLTISLSFIDQYLLSIDSGIATNVSNTFLVIDQHHHIFNDAGSLLPISPASPLQAVMVIPDTTAPVLLSFELDLNVGLLILQFSEPVMVPNLAVSAITLQSASNASGTSYTLTGGYSASADAAALLQRITLSSQDLNAIKALTELATSNENTFLSVAPNLTTDYAFNEAIPVPSSDAVPVAQLTSDTTAPELISFTLDMDAAALALTYDETVNASSFDPTQITFENSPGSPSISFTLTSGVVSASSYTMLLVILSPEDFNVLASEDQLAVSAMTTYLLAASGVITDTSGNPSIAVTGVLVTVFTADVTAPELIMFTLDLSLSELNLTFSEPVDVDTFDSESLTLQSGPGSMSTMYSLTGGTVTVVGNITTVLQLTLSENDVVALNALPGLATEYNNTYISFPRALVADYNANPVIAVLPENPVQVSGTVYLSCSSLSYHTLLLFSMFYVTCCSLLEQCGHPTTALNGGVCVNGLCIYTYLCTASDCTVVGLCSFPSFSRCVLH